MAVVAGAIFFIFRAFFALIPRLADRAPIKKWAALAGLLVTGFYLILSGDQVSDAALLHHDRCCAAGRAARSLIAALVALAFAPESIVHPSFQMSFAATLALIAGYERGAIELRGRADSSHGARAALWGVNEIVGLTIASLLAGLATTPYAAFHFHRIAPYGVIANLLAMPIMVTMPRIPIGMTQAETEEDCARAALVVATRGDPPADCKANVIARALWRDRGALTLRQLGNDFIVESARPKNFDRPWAAKLDVCVSGARKYVRGIRQSQDQQSCPRRYAAPGRHRSG